MAHELRHEPVAPHAQRPAASAPAAGRVDVAREPFARHDLADRRCVPVDFVDFFLELEEFAVPGVDAPAYFERVELARGHPDATPPADIRVHMRLIAAAGLE